MKKWVFLSLSLITLSALASDKVINGVYWPAEKIGRDVLLKHGYHDIQILYMQPSHCADGKFDQNSTGFRAISKNGHVVTGVVCGNCVIEKTTTETER